MSIYYVATQKQADEYGTSTQYTSYIAKFEKDLPSAKDMQEFSNNKEMVIFMQRLADEDS